MEVSFQKKKVVAVGPMTPVAENTNGEKHALSTSLIQKVARCRSNINHDKWVWPTKVQHASYRLIKFLRVT